MSGDNGFAEWGGYMDAKITKLEEQFTAASDPFRQSNLFAGISIYVNGLTDPSADELKRIMMVHGGTYHHYERTHTTYIIASNLPDVKVRNMNTSKIISPKWVVDCLREQRILDYTRYLLYTNQRSSQPCISFTRPGQTKLDKTTATTPIKTPLQPIVAKEEPTTEKVDNIMRGLNELNAKIREGLATPSSLISELVEKAPLKIGTVTKEEAKNNENNSSVNKNNSISAVNSGSGVALTAVNPKFLSEFYNNSRLHHIATLGASFKQYINDLREQHDSSQGFPARQQLKQRLQEQLLTDLKTLESPLVMHIDMDCFFVSVALRKHPQLRGLPIAVTHSRGGSAATEVPVHPNANRHLESELFAKRFEQHSHNDVLSDKARQGFDAKLSLSEIASCSYEARAKGVRNGMFVGQALKLCPELQTVSYEFEAYREVAFTLYNTVAQYTLDVEAVSCDEMFVDLSELVMEMHVNAMDFVEAIRTEVREKTGCPCSAGVGANKLQARLATKRAKPNGAYHLLPEDVESYMAETPIRELPGVGSSTAYNLKEANLSTCRDLQQVSQTRLQQLVGNKLGETLYLYCRGKDPRPLAYEQIRKSVSAEVNYGIRFVVFDELERFLRQLCTEVHTRLTNIQRRTKCITLKLMVRAEDAPIETSKFMGHGVCDQITKSIPLKDFTTDLDFITKRVLTTIKELNVNVSDLRGIGIQLTKLDEPQQCKEKKNQSNALKNMFERAAKKQIENQSSNSVHEMSKSPTKMKEPSQPTVSQNKRRGRPPIEVEVKKKPNIINMLQNVAEKRKTKAVNDVYMHPSAADIDPEVLAALPADICAEILNMKGTTIASNLNESDLQPSTSKAAQKKKERQRQAPENIPRNRSPLPTKVDEEFLAALPKDLQIEVQAQIAEWQKCAQNEVSESPMSPAKAVETLAEQTTIKAELIDEENLFGQPNANRLILQWVRSRPKPNKYDVIQISGWACDMVNAKLIDELYDGLCYLQRLLSRSTDCNWHKVYRVIYKVVQNAMAKNYDGKYLYLELLKCEKCGKC